MKRIQALIIALSLTLVSNCTLVGAGTFTIVGINRQPDAAEKQEIRKNGVRGSDGKMQYPDEVMSVGGHALLGAGIGLVIDAIVLTIVATGFSNFGDGLKDF